MTIMLAGGGWMKRRWIALAVGSALLATACGFSGPSRVRLIVPAEAGEHADRVARAITPCLSDQLGDEVTVENRPGENGVVGTREFVERGTKGKPLLVSSVVAPVVAPVFEPDVGYDFDEFTFVGVAHSTPMILFAAANGPFDTVTKLLGTAESGGAPVKVANTGELLYEDLLLKQLNVLEKTRLESQRVDSDAELLRGVVAGDYPLGLAALTPEHLASARSGATRVLILGGTRAPEALKGTPMFHQLTGVDMLAGIPVDTALMAPDDLGVGVFGTLMEAFEACVNKRDVRQDIGVEFVPTTMVTHGDLTSRYYDLERLIRLVQNPPS
jgi:tripartite-type tricarboxylate transporter receptor subunit TctC